ncbi:hypothetical protein PRZ48_006787 [Zasmidium cellare]|uniref:Uncharacterized protein n=1 Tax=Zasmidium cellare TaxID=395010 RepID=A0ABR0EIB2_ZASCE|nr:hypothetical protein PRZ48_006787 [Zasmidium cellare]
MRFSNVVALGLTACSSFAQGLSFIPHPDQDVDFSRIIQKHQNILDSPLLPYSGSTYLTSLHEATTDLLRFYNASAYNLGVNTMHFRVFPHVYTSERRHMGQCGPILNARDLEATISDGFLRAVTPKTMMEHGDEVKRIQEALRELTDVSAALDKQDLEAGILFNGHIETEGDVIHFPDSDLVHDPKFGGCPVKKSTRLADEKDEAGPTTLDGEESFEDQKDLNLRTGPASEAFKKILRLTAEIAAESKGTTFEAELRGIAEVLKERMMLEFAHLGKDVVDTELSAFMQDLMGEFGMSETAEPRGKSAAEATKDGEVSTWKFHDNDAEILDRHLGWRGCIMDFDSDKDVDDHTELDHEPQITTTDNAARDFATGLLTKEEKLQNLAKHEAKYQQRTGETRRQWLGQVKGDDKTSSKAPSVAEISQAVQELKNEMASVFEWYDHEFAMVKESISKNIALLNESLVWSEQEMLEKTKKGLVEWMWQDEFNEAADRESDSRPEHPRPMTNDPRFTKSKGVDEVIQKLDEVGVHRRLMDALEDEMLRR